MKKYAATYAAFWCFAALIYFAVVILSGFGHLRPFHLELFLYFIILVPIGEEAVFRGIIQRFIKSRFHWKAGPFTGANLTASLIFAAAHLLSLPLFQAALVYIPSLILGRAYDKSGSIIPGAFIHAVFNMNVFILYRSDILKEIF